MESHSTASSSETVTGYQWKVKRSLEEAFILALINVWQKPQPNVVWNLGRINNQVKTDLQPPGLPRPLPPTLLGNQWVLKWVLHDWVWMKHLYEAGGWAQGGEVPSSLGKLLCHLVSGFDRIVLVHASGLLCQFCWDLPFGPTGLLFLRRTDDDGQGWLIASPILTLNSAYTWIVFYIPW